MKNTKEEFCKKYNLSDDQFIGNVEISGDLDLRNLTSIPEGFNPTVGGSVILKNGLTCKSTKPKGPLNINTPKNKLLFWQDGKYVSADRMFTEVLSKKGNIYKVRKVHSQKEFFLVTDGKTHAHGETAEKAKEDFRFKLMAEKLKSEPILEDTVITIKHYRLLTGACELGVNSWMQSQFNETERTAIMEKGIKAKELLPILEKTNAYGIERFKRLVNF